MKITIPAKELTRAMQLLLAAVETKDIKSDILKCVQIRARADGSVRFAMTNIAVIAQFTTINVNVEEPGVVLISAATLSDIAKKKINQTITISQTGLDRVVVERDASFKIPYTKPETFTIEVPEVMCRGAKIPIGIFNFVIERCLYSAAETKRFIDLTDAVHLEYESPYLIGVATDGYRSPIVKHLFEPGVEGFEARTIPRVACHAVAALAKQFSQELRERAKRQESGDVFIPVEHVETFDTQNRLHIKFGSLYISATKSVDSFPDWRTVLQDWTLYTRIRVDPNLLREAVDDLTILKGIAVVFDALPGGIQLSEKSVIGDADAAFLPAEVTGHVPNRCALNAKQLLQYIDSILKFDVVNEVEFYMPTVDRFPAFFSYAFEEGFLDYVQGVTNINE